jgi:hypothetical protein
MLLATSSPEPSRTITLVFSNPPANNPVSPLECAVTNSVSVSPLDSAVTKADGSISKHGTLRPFRMNSYKICTCNSFRMRSYKKGGWGPMRTSELIENQHCTVLGAFSRKPLWHILLRISAPANPYRTYSYEKMGGGGQKTGQGTEAESNAATLKGWRYIDEAKRRRGRQRYEGDRFRHGTNAGRPRTRLTNKWIGWVYGARKAPPRTAAVLVRRVALAPK